MNKIKYTSLALLLLVILDATGDAFRIQGWQFLHHAIETLQIAGWVAVWSLFEFNLVFIVMYITGRLFLFDLTLNVIAGNPLLYMGENDAVGWLVRGFANLVKQNYMHFSLVLKFLAGVWWMSYFFTNKQFRSL